MSDLMKRLGNAYDILWNNKEFPTCAEWRSELIPAVQDLEAKVVELEGLCAITGVIEREKKYIALQAKVEKLTAIYETSKLIGPHSRKEYWDAFFKAHEKYAALSQG